MDKKDLLSFCSEEGYSSDDFRNFDPNNLLHMSRISTNIYSGKNVYNIGSSKVYSLKELFLKIIKKNKSKSKVKHLPKSITLIILWILTKIRLIDFTSYHNTLLISNIVLDISKAQKELNYFPKYDSFEIFNDAYLYYKNNKNNYLRGSSQKPKMKILKLIKFFS